MCFSLPVCCPENVSKSIYSLVDHRLTMKAQTLAEMVCNLFNLPSSGYYIHCILTTPSHPDSVQHACELVATQDGNAWLLNVSTDGVSCDVNNNKKINLDYLDGMSKTLALVDNKDDNKKAHGQH